MGTLDIALPGDDVDEVDRCRAIERDRDRDGRFGRVIMSC